MAERCPYFHIAQGGPSLFVCDKGFKIEKREEPHGRRITPVADIDCSERLSGRTNSRCMRVLPAAASAAASAAAR